MRKKILFKLLFTALIITLMQIPVLCQNIGQTGDSLYNYTDINGNKQGRWEAKHSNGNIKYKGFFVDNRPVGQFYRYDIRGNLYAKLNYLQNCDTIIAEFYHASGSKAVTGTYNNKNKEGIWKYYSDQGKLFLQESYKQNNKHGTFLQYTADGIVIEEVNWQMGVKHGNWKKFYVEGPKMWESTYVNGKLEGEAKSYFKNGVLQKQGNFKNDLMDGDWLKFSQNGKLEKVYHYKNGVCPGLEKENELMLEQMEQNKGQIEDPAEHANDPEWFMRK